MDLRGGHETGLDAEAFGAAQAALMRQPFGRLGRVVRIADLDDRGLADLGQDHAGIATGLGHVGADVEHRRAGAMRLGPVAQRP